MSRGKLLAQTNVHFTSNDKEMVEGLEYARDEKIALNRLLEVGFKIAWILDPELVQETAKHEQMLVEVNRGFNHRNLNSPMVYENERLRKENEELKRRLTKI